MGPIKFYWETVKLAFRHSLDHTQYTLFIAFLIVGVAGYFIPKLANWETTATGPEAALIVLGGIVMARLLLAPYWLYKDKADEVAKLTNSAGGDLSKFSNVDPIPLTMASYLMTDQMPGTKVDGNADAHLMFEYLVHAVGQGEVLPYNWTNRAFAKMSYNATYGNTGNPVTDVPKITGKTRVPQSELVRFAVAHGLSPIFIKAKVERIAPLARLLATATAFQDEIVRRRLNVAESRLARGDAKMMVEMIDRERIRCPELMNADTTAMSLEQVAALSRYQSRERELEMCIDGIEKRQDEHRAKPTAAAIDFKNRLSYLVMALDGLIESLRA